MVDESHILSPGDSYTFAEPKPAQNEWRKSHATVPVAMLLAPHDIMERLIELQRAGRTPKTVYVQASLWTHLLLQGGRSLDPQLYRRTTFPQGRRKRWLFGVEVKWTRGKLPFYVVDDKGNKV